MPPAPLLTTNDRDQWERDGWLLARQAVPRAAIDGVRNRFAVVVDRIIRQLKSEGVIDDEGTHLPFEMRLARVAGRHANRFGRSWRQEIASREVFDLQRAEPLASIIGELTGTDVIGHPVYNARPKLPGQQLTVVPWHQDSGYFGQQSVGSLIPTAWIPLVPVDESTGCLQIAQGSHRLGLLEHRVEDREGRFLEIPEAEVDPATVVTVPMEVGDALLFHNLTLHRSLPHTADTIRWAIDIRYLRDGDNPGSFYWNDRSFKWVVRSETQPIASYEEWAEQWK